MCITIEDLKAMKESYQDHIRLFEMKVSVIDDLISVASAKEPCKCETVEGLEAVSYIDQPIVETTTDGSY